MTSRIIAIASLVAAGSASAQVIDVDFDGVTAPSFFLDTAGPEDFVQGAATFSGGAVIAVADELGTSTPNAYGTIAPIFGDPRFGFTIALDIAGGATNVTGLFIDGGPAATASISAFDAGNNLVDSAFFSTSGNTASMFDLSGSNIARVQWDFAGDSSFFVDDLSITLVPSPATAGVLGLAALGARRRRA